ncbi:hypothetical protein [Pseudomonas sp. C2B4]|uniref:hypothetical protein n=1 Tax=Pseudomonas sp. C2B4 TaxID=2735270 RepID=UPI00158606D4|nr:hypothetical protein [Pseudomonas sp. C2B4]NUU35115.1 hypothetical protein [Pseudomonas sp. C2B4]
MLFRQIAKNWKPLAVILIATILCGVLYIFSEGDTRNFALSLGTCFLSALVVIIAVDISLSASNEQARLQLFTTSLLSIRPALQQIGGVLFNIVKATAVHPMAEDNLSLSKMIEVTRAAETRYINPRHEAPVVPRMDWLNYISSAFIHLSDSLNKFSEKYIMLIDRETIELCEKMRTHQFIHLCNESRRVDMISEFPGDFGSMMMAFGFVSTEEKVSAFHDYLCCVEELNNKLLVAEIEIVIPVSWGDNVSPKLGAARTATA